MREFFNYRKGPRITTSHEIDLRFRLLGAVEPGGYSAAATVLDDEMHTLTNIGTADQFPYVEGALYDGEHGSSGGLVSAPVHPVDRRALRARAAATD